MGTFGERLPIFTMTQMDARITELVARLTALERERVDILAEINTLRSVRSEEAAVIKAVPSAKAGDPIDRNSTIEKKIALFRRLFRGRSDVFPIRWRNRTTGRSGYAPACANEWQRGICEKPKVKCSACPNQAFLAVDDASIERHLRGTDASGAPFVMGVYPMLADNASPRGSQQFPTQRNVSSSRPDVTSARVSMIPASIPFFLPCRLLGKAPSLSMPAGYIASTTPSAR